MALATDTADRNVATPFGWWLGQAVRVTVALLLLGGLLGAALGAARTMPLAAVADDLAAGRVSEVVLTDSHEYGPPSLQNGDWHRVVRWKVTGSGWRTADLDTSPLSLTGPTGVDPATDDPGAAGDFGTAGDTSTSGDPGTAGDTSTSGDPGASDDPGSAGDLGTADDQADRNEVLVRRLAVRAGVPVSTAAGGPVRRLVQLATLVTLVLVLLLVVGPQPRRATKWAWFWLLLVPGGLGALAWVALESPWSSRANRRLEPLPHRDQPEDRRLTGGRTLVLGLVLSAVASGVGIGIGNWLAG